MKVNSLSDSEQDKFLTNTYGIEKVQFSEDVQHFCPLGEQIGVTHYEVEVVPGMRLAELVQLHWDIQAMMGKTFTLESGVAMVLDTLKSHYADAKEITVTASCGTNRHMATKVTVSYRSE